MGSLKSLNKYLFRYRYRLALGILFVTLSNIFGVVPAQIVRLAFDLANENIIIYKLFNGFEEQSEVYKLLGMSMLVMGLSIFVMYLIRGIFLFFMRQTIIVVSRLIEYDLKNDLFEHYQSFSLSFQRSSSTGDLMSRISEDVSRVRMYLGPAIMYSLNTLVLFILIISSMIHINPMMTFYSLLPLPFLTVIIYYVNNKILAKSEQIQIKLAEISTFSQEFFSGIRVIKSFNRELQSINDFENKNEVYRRKSMDLALIQAVFFPTVLFLGGLSIVITIYVGGKEVERGNISTGNIAEFIIYIQQLIFPMMLLGWVSAIIQRAAASQKRINDVMNISSDIISGKKTAKNIKGELTFENVSYTYKETNITAVSNISFKANPGEFIAFVGKTGSGKSTIVNIILRMFNIDKGTVLIDNERIEEYNIKELRDNISVVPQNVFLYSDTIYNNIIFGIDNNSISEERVIEVSKQANIYNDIMGFKDGFDTVLGERGISLSGGQKQRVSIARALIKDSKIIIFDDSLSAVDTKTEEEILTNLGSLVNQKTIIIISNRISSIQNANKIFFIADNQIIESGTHNELLNKNGVYYDLYQKQISESANNN